jgi:RHS repeat-associated protein
MLSTRCCQFLLAFYGTWFQIGSNPMRKKLSWGREFSAIAKLFWLGVVFVSLTFQAMAHICGPPVRIVRPGDLFYHYILTDVFETAPSQYNLQSNSDPTVVDVDPKGLFSAFYYGEFAISPLKEGSADLVFHWAYVPFGAQSNCNLHVIVTNNVTLAAANYSQSAISGDPVNAYTGALTQSEPPDLDLGGPMPLQFRRYYDSSLDGSLLIRSALGINWSHNFDTRVIRFSNRLDIVTYQGARSQFQKSNNVWQAIGSGRSYQVIENVNGSVTNIVVGDRRANLIYTFDNFGELISIADGKGNAHTLTYTNNSLKSVTDGLGRTITFNVGGPQHLLSVSDGVRSVRFGHSTGDEEINLLLTVTNPIGGVVTYTYDPSNAIPALLTSKTLPRGNTPYVQVFDTLGRVIRQIELGLRTNKFVYGAGTTTITNPLGGTLTYTHNTNGSLTSYKDEANQTVNIGLNSSNQRSVITDRLGNKTGVAYDPISGKTSAVTNADGSVMFFTYTNYVVSNLTFYALSQVTYPDASTEKYFYDSVGNVTRRIDRSANVWMYTYNNHGQPLTITNPRGGTTYFTYNPDATLASMRDTDTGVTTYAYDSLHRLMRTTNPDGSTNSAQVDLNDRVTGTTDERNNTYTYFYDSNGNVTNILDPNGASLKFAYDGMDRVIMATDRLGHNEMVSYDALDRVASYTDKNGNTTGFGYDARSRLVGITNPAGKAWNFSANAEDIVTARTNPLGRAYFNKIDPTGFVTGHTNPLGNASSLYRNSTLQIGDFVDELGRSNHFAYNAGMLASLTRPRIGSISVERDPLQRVQRFTDFNGQDWFYGYTDMGRPKSFSDPMVWTTFYDYDLRGRLSLTTFADGVTRSNHYDYAGNLMRVRYSDGTDFSFGYDKLNRLTSAPFTHIALDAEGRPTNTESWNINFGASYDFGGRLTSATYSNGAFKVDYSYDIRNRLTLVSNGLYGAWMKFNYDDNNNVTNIQRANGISTTLTYDFGDQLTRIQHGSYLDLKYTFNKVGKATQLQWTGLLDPNKWAISASISYTYNSGSQISNPGFNWDWQGRLKSWDTHNYTWNGASQLTVADGVSYQYNAWDEQVTRIENSQTKWCFYNRAVGQDRLAGEYNWSTGQYERYYVWAPNGPLLFTIDALSNSVSYYHFDRNGSTIALSDSLGKITDAYAYSLYGNLLSHTGSISQPFTYLGASGVRYDFTTDLYKIGTRWYSPNLKSFLSLDYSWPNLDNPQSGPYSFANDDPLDYINRRGSEAQPIKKNLIGQIRYVDTPRISRQIVTPVKSGGRFDSGDFLRTYDFVQTMTGGALPDLAESEINGVIDQIFGYSGGYDCCCCCCCCCCYCCCCCCCCYYDGPGYGSVGIQIAGLVRGEINTPVRRTSFSQYISLTEAYRKFGTVRVFPQSSMGMRSMRIPGVISVNEAARATDDFRSERNLRTYNFSSRFDF